MIECWVYACRRSAWRRGLCTFHHHQRALLQDHCTKWMCVKPCYRDTLCRHHYRIEYGQCCVPNCTNRFYMSQLCRKHYSTHRYCSPKSCRLCDKRVFLNNLCFRHFNSTPCKSCSSMAYAKGLCVRHYFRSKRSTTVVATDSTAPSTS